MAQDFRKKETLNLLRTFTATVTPTRATSTMRPLASHHACATVIHMQRTEENDKKQETSRKKEKVNDLYLAIKAIEISDVFFSFTHTLKQNKKFQG